MRYTELQMILRETVERIENRYVPYEDEYQVRIQFMTSKEKNILRRFFMKLDWNLGSAKVLSMLKNAGITTASEFILSNIHSKETTQQVMNDLWETEHILLAELFSNSCLNISISTSLKEIIQDSLNSALDDLLENHNIIPCNYLHRLDPHLQISELELLKTQHMQLLLSKNCTTIEHAYGFQLHWRVEINENKRTVLGQLMMDMIQDKTSAIDTLFGAVQNLGSSISWKHFLQLLHLLSVTIEEEKSNISRLKIIIKEMFNKVIQDNNFDEFLLLMLTAREICSSNKSILGDYTNWYKMTFGEMSYRVSKVQFMQVMEMMTKLIELENNLEYLPVHVTVSISSPPKCMDLVVTYKQLCRAQLAKINNKANTPRPMEQPDETNEISIVIDD
ncbi:uncharacterized protein LOC131437522 isoform X2 [Malaya genurostris]|uniref:uncharacterized protein LOC131437522 isoform X2 n=1 Tax=Malaya genurostris TaxID=325434 RepID=UPI0026F3F59F|nr:uncharacterized protein LOC131437522 isoform X2 [Malaya genurostris]